jgi:hypothetical protein
MTWKEEWALMTAEQKRPFQNVYKLEVEKRRQQGPARRASRASASPAAGAAGAEFMPQLAGGTRDVPIAPSTFCAVADEGFRLSKLTCTLARMKLDTPIHIVLGLRLLIEFRFL